MKKVMLIVSAVLVAGVGGVGAFLLFFMPVAAETEIAALSAVAVAAPNITRIDAPVGFASYPDITVEAGTTATINFVVEPGNLTGCNNELMIPEFHILMGLVEGDNPVTITFPEAGIYYYNCWMYMIYGKIIVVEPGQGEVGAARGKEVQSAKSCLGIRMGGAGQFSCGYDVFTGKESRWEEVR